MKDLDEQLYTGLTQLLEFEGDVEEVFGSTFQITYTSMYGEVKTHDLKPDGANIPVTSENRQEYVELYYKWILKDSVADQVCPNS